MKQLHKIHFANLPTPIEDLPRLSEALNGPRIYVKRDDLTGLGFGGNKARKLEYLLYLARESYADTIITTGAAQSNHCRQTAAAAAKLGMDCVLVLTMDRREAQNKPVNKSRFTGNLLLDHLLGAEIVWTNLENREEVLMDTFNQIKNRGRRPFLIPYGGSSSIGAAAYVFAIRELLEQIQNINLKWIIFASSSGGTQAGITLGAKLFGFNGEIVGISVDENAVRLKKRIGSLISQTTEDLEENIQIGYDEITVFDNYLGGGYGVIGDQEIEAIYMFARLEGLFLDPVYTSRAAAGMIDLIRQGYFKTDNREPSSLLFWHTGGTPSLFAEKYQSIFIR